MAIFNVRVVMGLEIHNAPIALAKGKHTLIQLVRNVAEKDKSKNRNNIS
jgi:hypothetical protein